MKQRSNRAFGLVATGAMGFLAGMLTMGVLMFDRDGPRLPGARTSATLDDCGDAAALARDPDTDARVEPAGVSRTPPPPEAAPPRMSADPVSELRDRDLVLPVRGVQTSALQGSFADKRGANRRHEAIDILAPRGTAVLAVEDGTIARLHFSAAGGTTIYQFDPDSEYVYYYAHLDKYATGLRDGARVRRGDVIGYVGTTGNAPPNTPHLHFAVYRLSAAKQWWQGTPIDPFEVLKN